MQAEVAWRCCWAPAPAALSRQELWPPLVPAGTPGSAPCPSSCQPPAQQRGWHPGAPVGPVATATSGWRAVQGCPGSVATARAGSYWVPAQEWRPSAVPVMLPAQVLDWGRGPLLLGLRRQEQKGRLGLSLVVLGLPLWVEPPPVPPATPRAALPATSAAARSGAVVARCRVARPAIAAGGPCRWISRGRAADRGTGVKRW